MRSVPSLVPAPTHAAALAAPTVTREPDGTLVIRLPPPPPPRAPDELVPFPSGNFERNAARALMRDGHLPPSWMCASSHARDLARPWGGVADKVIQRRMGHASPTTTDR